MGKTIVEKILAKAAGKPEVSPGEYVEVGIKTFIQVSSDGGGTPMPDTFAKYGWNKLWDPTKVVIVPDHCGSYTPLSYDATNNNRENHRRNSEWARKMGVPEENILDLGRVGNCHHLGVEEGWALPGSIYVHADTHAMTVGGVGCFGPCITASMAALLRTGLTWFRVPESIKFNITGKLQDGVMGRDVYEYILRQIGPAGAIYKIMEYTGPVINEMSIDGRLSMCCLSVFTGAKLGIVNPDKKVIDWFKARTNVPFQPLVSDTDANYVKTYDYDGSKIEPQIVVPPHRHTVKDIAEVEGTKVTSAFIGSCASGRDDDMRIAARILKGRKVQPGVMLNITPGSSAAMMRAAQEGVLATLLEAGCFVCAPGCGMCPGYYTPLTKNEVCITSSTTNYPGRMGDESAQVYLGSPATVAASAIEGKITDPRKYL